MKNWLRDIALFSSLCLPLVACDHDHDHGAEEVDQVAEGCKHMEFGPDVALDVAPGLDAAIETVHTRYDLTLSEAVRGGYEGRILYTSGGAMHYLMLDQAADLLITDSEGDDVEPMMLENEPTSCPLARSVHHVMLPEGVYTLDISGAASASMSLVVHVANADHSHAH